MSEAMASLTARSALTSQGRAADVSGADATSATAPLATARDAIAPTSGLGRADRVHHRLGLGVRLYEIVGLRSDPLAERLLVAFDNGDALLLDGGERLLFDREPMRASIDRG